MCARRLDNLDKIGTCLQRHRLLKLAREEIENLSGHMLQIELCPPSPKKKMLKFQSLVPVGVSRSVLSNSL